MKKQLLAAGMCIAISAGLAACGNGGAAQETTAAVAETAEGEAGYSTSCLEAVRQQLGCSEVKADKILKRLCNVGVNNVIEASVKEESGGSVISVRTSDQSAYKAYVDPSFHLFAVQDAGTGEYLYSEYELAGTDPETAEALGPWPGSQAETSGIAEVETGPETEPGTEAGTLPETVTEDGNRDSTEEQDWAGSGAETEAGTGTEPEAEAVIEPEGVLEIETVGGM